MVAEHFAEERPSLQPLPAGPFQAVLRLERRITRDGMVSVDGNLYSVPDTTRRRPVEVNSTAHEVRILEQGRVVARGTHAELLATVPAYTSLVTAYERAEAERERAHVFDEVVPVSTGGTRE